MVSHSDYTGHTEAMNPSRIPFHIIIPRKDARTILFIPAFAGGALRKSIHLSGAQT
jgi:hypothetical protein